MEEDRSQKELFEFEKPKRSFPKFGKMFARSGAGITLTMEKAAFISIGLILLMVIIYALGVERGRALNLAKQVTQPIQPVQPAPVKPQVAPAAQEANKPYTIVAVTFRGKDSAEVEANRLKRNGYDAFVMQSDPYILVCIGAYPDKDSAQSKKAIANIRRLYKDAYFKLR